MSKLYVLTETALQELKKSEKILENIDKCYSKEGESVLADHQVNELRDCEIPDDLCNQLINNINDEFAVAIVLYEALKITPLLASNEQLWAYLTHGPLLRFVQEKWPVETVDNKEGYIRDHWFVSEQSRIMRNALASLWWGVEISKLDDEEDPYRLTRILFMNNSLRVVFLARLLRSRNVLRGILEWFAVDETRTERMEARCGFIAKYLNQLASIKQLTILRWDEVVSLIDEVEDVIMSIETREDYQRLSVSDVIYTKRENNRL